MDTIEYNSDKMDLVHNKIQQLFDIVSELEEGFPGRYFTLDGHLLGSIGEVLSVYYYGIQLFKASEETHDGIVDGKKVQIKITQQDNIMISSEPEYLIVLYLTKDGKTYEVYNGPAKEPWENIRNKDSHNNKHLRVNKLMELDAAVNPADRIIAKNHIDKMQKEYKNRKQKK